MSNPRQDANRALIDLLIEQIEGGPDLRFGQVLWNLGIVMSDGAGGILDPHAEESVVTLDRAKQRAERLRRAAE
ncbi:hypothetical protein DEIGR_101994 [Deinococcus grandis]|uniref:Uncharacterized protein n=1 Tax=Deinococcus grandis TaxID=57498 RepID=A0A100HJV5_9DEIO|nr:hypothetical protein [Deinococcus grandis]BBN94534.1 hypothetical protein DEGR_12670 [Deinococcus grandis]GAQ21967.1 hypothetical protein DEIGR_101994 [Deinococcus grandis]